MTRSIALVAVLGILLSACAPSPSTVDGVRVYRISQGDTADIQYRTLDSINSLRTAAGLPSLKLSPQLNAAASSHSQDMSLQNRPWNFGSDGSSPLMRVARTGYPGTFIGQAVAESYESEIDTLGAWMDRADARAIIMDPAARDLGFAWFQERNGKIWWTLITGA
ncbi:CAP domain-containing protein [Tropicimonas isoalkanivorans]|uniref:Cysteine-rich secretory protein family protein n=1 Tax=Tropicimonas isoalkanivorans TaxID=441112 RepID=A0A1I1M544_9RHOB|nr:CAP domain-containing protein [Tropicimonas isoalkanivorans]SFC78308.1 Cysteine-rich secretory protein family protein [Tropicimonas isoalkanivorans]